MKLTLLLAKNISIQRKSENALYSAEMYRFCCVRVYVCAYQTRNKPNHKQTIDLSHEEMSQVNFVAQQMYGINWFNQSILQT